MSEPYQGYSRDMTEPEVRAAFVARFDIGDRVYMQGYDDPLHVFYGIVAEITEFQQFQNASNDDWYWCANLKYDFDGEKSNHWYPVRFLTKVTNLNHTKETK